MSQLKEVRLKTRIDLRATRSVLQEDFERTLKVSNQLWEGVIRLVITLASSSVLITLGFAEKFFPDLGVQGVPVFLVLAWAVFFLAVIFGIVAELEETIFYGTQSRRKADELRVIDQHLVQGKEFVEVDMPCSYIVDAGILWGVLTINAFIIASLFLCVALLERFYGSFACHVVVGVGLTGLVELNIYLLSKYKNMSSSRPSKGS
jgi:uncharacterized PurR-regulated membrane protein YhhQ (DUF165 family)